MDPDKNLEEYKKELTPLAYQVTRLGGTEPPFSGEFYNNKSTGLYLCVCCGVKLFSSNDKCDSGTGWPSFKQTLVHENIKEIHPEPSRHTSEYGAIDCRGAIRWTLGALLLFSVAPNIPDAILVIISIITVHQVIIALMIINLVKLIVK